MSNNFLITVAIPTYNRSDTLEKIILQLSLEKQKSFLILVSDDSSSDNTKEIVYKYQKIMPNLNYSRNEVNLGFSGNVCRLYELSTTPYIWFLCDDDTVLPGAVTKIIEAIKKYRPTIALFNCTWLDSYGRKMLAGVNRNYIYQNINKLIDYQPLMRTTYLSILVMKRKNILKKLILTQYKDNIFFQVSLSLLLLSDKFRLCEIASTIIHRNVGFKYGEFFKFCVVDHLKAIHIIPHIFDNKKFIKWSKKKLYVNMLLYLSQKIGLFRYEGKMSSRSKRLIFQYYGLFYGLIFMSFPMVKVIIPTLITKLFYLIRLISIHGYRKGLFIYKKNINRAFTDRRKTGFTNYI